MVPRRGNLANICEGDRATFFLKGKKFTSTLVRGMMRIGKFSFPGDAIIGKSFGKHELAGVSMIVLPALTRDHMDCLERGPQIILPCDAATILLHADISCGSTVLEAGSGSGSLTIALTSAVGEDGCVISMDINRQNMERAQRNVRKAGYGSRVNFLVGDVRNQQNTVVSIHELNVDRVDAVILDIPDPWDAVGTVEEVLRVGGILVSYLPTINQVEQFRKEIEGWDPDRRPREAAFIDSITMETLMREIVVNEGAVRPDYSMLGHTGYLTFARKV